MTIHTESVLLGIMIVLSAFFAMSETALLSISRYKVRHWVEKKRFGSGYVKKLKDNPEILLSTILIGNNLVNTAAAAIATSIALQVFQHNAIGIATGVATFLILIFGDVTPKSIGSNNNEILAPIVAPVIWNLSVAIYPVTKALEYFLKGINKLVGTKKISIITEEELKSIVKASEEEGSIKELEKKFQFGIDIIGFPTVREKDGLAMSSRNRLLNEKERKQALVLSQVLNYCKENYHRLTIDEMKKYAAEKTSECSLARADYFEFADAETLHLLDNKNETTRPIALMALYIGNIRLIDNVFI